MKFVASLQKRNVLVSMKPSQGAARAACALSLACASPSYPCCLPRRPLCPAAAGLRLLSSPSSLFVLWLSLPASVVVGFVLVWCFGLLSPFLMLGLQRPPASATVTSSLVAFGGWFVPEFVCGFVRLGCPVASSLWHVCFV